LAAVDMDMSTTDISITDSLSSFLVTGVDIDTLDADAVRIRCSGQPTGHSELISQFPFG
jgi:hypothetical protein